MSEEKCPCDLSLDADNRYTDLHRIIYRIFSSAFFSVEYGYNSVRVINHPFIPDLKTGPAVALTNIFHEVCCHQYLTVCFLPFLAPTALKAVIGASTHQFDIAAFITEHQHGLCCPDIYAPSEPQFSPVLDWGFVIQCCGETFRIKVTNVLIQRVYGPFHSTIARHLTLIIPLSPHSFSPCGSRCGSDLRKEERNTPARQKLFN